MLVTAAHGRVVVSSAVGIPHTALEAHACVLGAGDGGGCAIASIHISREADGVVGDGAYAVVARPVHACVRVERGG